MLLNKTIRLFLDSIGRREEYEFYLNKFQSAGTDCFALLVPDLESLEQGAEALAFDLNFLFKLGLKPAVVLCDDAEAKWNLLKDNPLFERTVFPKLGRRKASVPVFVEENVQTLESLLQKVPIIGKRVHFIRAAGGMSVDYYYTQKSVMALSSEDKILADTAAALLETRPGTHISVTAPMNLLEEIFTVKGAGTVFRRGSTILSSGKPDTDRLLALLQESFGKKPKEGILAAVAQIYFEENYRGAALLEKHPEGLYLSKFAVGSEARGEGLAQELWDEVCKNNPSFFWRSRKGNPINQWYDRHADGRHNAGDWVVFWRGTDAAAITGLIAFCLARPVDFI
jgi:hypothetical protein